MVISSIDDSLELLREASHQQWQQMLSCQTIYDYYAHLWLLLIFVHLHLVVFNGYYTTHGFTHPIFLYFVSLSMATTPLWHTALVVIAYFCSLASGSSLVTTPFVDLHILYFSILGSQTTYNSWKKRIGTQNTILSVKLSSEVLTVSRDLNFILLKKNH